MCLDRMDLNCMDPNYMDLNCMDLNCMDPNCMDLDRSSPRGVTQCRVTRRGMLAAPLGLIAATVASPPSHDDFGWASISRVEVASAAIPSFSEYDAAQYKPRAAPPPPPPPPLPSTAAAGLDDVRRELLTHTPA